MRKDEHHDIAQIKVSTRIPVQLRIGPDDKLAQGQQIRLLGFPSYHVGDGVAISAGPITQERMYSGVKHFVIEPHIVRGNSGGPVLDRENRVVGVAIKGQGTPGRFSQYDELSSFVPISALEQMK